MTNKIYPKWLKPWNRVFYDMPEKELLARCIYGEARGESYEGKLAVGCVIRNRVLTPGWWGNSYHRVILSPWQFSCFNESEINRLIPKMLNPKDSFHWQECKNAAEDIFNGIPDITGGATHYFTIHIKKPEWHKRMLKTCVIGNHEFYDELGTG